MKDQDITATVSAIAGRLAQTRAGTRGDELVALMVDQLLCGVSDRQAEVLRRCAIPRWFDVSVLRVLREHEDGNERVLERLATYSFVRDLGEGRLTFYDEVRDALNAEWQRERPDEARTIHRRLYSYFSTRTTPTSSTNRAMPLIPDSTALSVVPMTAQTDLMRREAHYHLLHVDQDRGLEQLRRSCEALEDAHRLAEAELLVHTAAETPLGPRERRWVQYLRARILRAALRLDDAAAQLDALRARGDLEPELAAEVSSTLGEVYSETGQWARATELFRQSLSYFARANNSPAVARTMLLLGKAYEGLGDSIGSWYAPTPPANPLLATSYSFWFWLLGLPFRVAILLIGRRSRLLPRPTHCARYQNWLLIRLYNTARTWYADASEVYRHLDDAPGRLQTEQRLADMLLHYGYHDEARAAVEGLLARPEARDPYRRAWLLRSLAACHLAAGATAPAWALLAEAQAVFDELGDLRRQASVLSLRGKAAVQAGAVDEALRSYEAGLTRCRALRYAPAREHILHELRAWQRGPALDGAGRARVAALVAAEPEKRYVGRFLGSYRGLLQSAILAALALALLLIAVVAPRPSFGESDLGLVIMSVFFNPWRMLGVTATLTLSSMAGYAAVAMAVIYWLPINRIVHEQPDVIVTRPGSIARFDGQGNLTLALPWSEVRRWLALDRHLWEQPLSLWSRTYLEGAPGRELTIDGITGWYTELQADIGRHLAAAGNAVARRDLGYSLLQSWAGLSATVGVALLLLVAVANNGWLHLGGMVPPSVAAAIWFVALSGAPILAPLAFWLAYRPLKLQRALLHNERWPLFLAAAGGLAIGDYVLFGGRAFPLRALSLAGFGWGAYVLAETLTTMAAPGRPGIRLAAVIAASLLALAIVAQPALAHYRWLESYIARNQALSGVTAAATSCSAAEQARALGEGAVATWMIQADCAATVRDWDRAKGFYDAAARASAAGSGEQALALYNLALVASRSGDGSAASAATDGYRAICANPTTAPLVCSTLAAAASKPPTPGQ